MKRRKKGKKRTILDTSVLLDWWNHCRSQFAGEIDVARVGRWANDLIARYDTNAIVTPIFIEVVGGATSKKDLQLARAYLAPFECVDHHRVLPGDWDEAIRLAQRVSPGRRPRGLGDCLIRAIAKRMRYEIVTFDQGFPS